MTAADFLKWLAGAVLFLAWGALVMWQVAPPEPFIAFVQATLIGLAAHGLTVSGTVVTAPPPPPSTSILPNGEPRPPLYIPGGQKGSISLGLYTILIIGTLVIVACCSGCASFGQGQFENRIVCTVAGDGGFVVSRYGQIGIASEIAEQDSKIICAAPLVFIPQAK